MSNKQELENQILEVMEKQKKYKPNSIMGIHWSSKLSRLKRQVEKLK